MKKTDGLWIGLLVGVLSHYNVAALANSQPGIPGINVQQIQNALQTAHASWHVKDNWVSKLSKSDIQRMLGSQIGPRGQLDYESVRTKDTAIDWRNKDGVNWLGPVMNQGNCGSCVAFSTVATLEAQTSIAYGSPWLHPSYSPQALFACGGATCDTGWVPDQAASFLQNTGIPDEACLPYTSGSTGDDVQCSAKCSDSDSRTLKIAGSSMPSSYGGSVDAVKAALAQGPLITTLFVYADFVPYASGVYKHTTGDMLGGHAVSLVGYDDTKRAWLIRNSWGPEWGENGFAWVSWDDTSGVGADTWHLDVKPPQGYLSVQSPTDREFVSGSYTLNAMTSGTKGEPVVFHVTNNGKDAATVSCSAANSGSNSKGPGLMPVTGGPAVDIACTSPLDTTALKEGRYEVYAQGSSSGVRSQVREFFVLNSDPVMSLSFTAAPDTDLTKPLNGRPEFVVKADFGAVPIQHVEFRAIDGSGKIVSTKSNDYVLPQMKMGWRTISVPDGQYTILFHGETTFKGKVFAVDSPSMSITVKN